VGRIKHREAWNAEGQLGKLYGVSTLKKETECSGVFEGFCNCEMSGCTKCRALTGLTEQLLLCVKVHMCTAK